MTYYVYLTYKVSIRADDEKEALLRARDEVESGDWNPCDVQVMKKENK